MNFVIDPDHPEPQGFVLRIDVQGDPPSQNESWKTRIMMQRGRPIATIYKAAAVKAWQALVATAARAAAPRRLPVFGPDAKLRVDMLFRFRRIDRDIDGPVKATLDALGAPPPARRRGGVRLPRALGIAFQDDRQVKQMWITSTLDRDNPGVTIFVSEIA